MTDTSDKKANDAEPLAADEIAARLGTDGQAEDTAEADALLEMAIAPQQKDSIAPPELNGPKQPAPSVAEDIAARTGAEQQAQSTAPVRTPFAPQRGDLDLSPVLIEPEQAEPNFLRNQWKRIDGWISWVRLSRYRNSFLARAITALSLSALVLANVPTMLTQAGVDFTTMRITFVGSLVFLLGYVLCGLWTPPEFRQAGEVDEIVKRMAEVSSQALKDSRLKVARSLYSRMLEVRALTAPYGQLRLLFDTLRTTAGTNTFSGEERQLFQADLDLRKHDYPGKRLFIAIILLVGGLFLILPTLNNVRKAICKDFM